MNWYFFLFPNDEFQSTVFFAALQKKKKKEQFDLKLQEPCPQLWVEFDQILKYAI